MLIGGLQKFTSLDYPEKIAATIFTVGCNFRCPYCHNGEIVEVSSGGIGEFGSENVIIAEDEVLRFLESRIGELDGVCVTGGEPTLQKDLADFMSKVKEMGFLVKLDTNGSNPEIIAGLIKEKLVDYFAIDIKTAFSKYRLLGAEPKQAENVLESVDMIAKSKAELELRTTMVPGIVSLLDFDEITEKINAKNREILPSLCRYALQPFRPQKCLKKEFEQVEPYAPVILEEAAFKLKKYCWKVSILS